MTKCYFSFAYLTMTITHQFFSVSSLQYSITLHLLNHKYSERAQKLQNLRKYEALRKSIDNLTTYLGMLQISMEFSMECEMEIKDAFHHEEQSYHQPKHCTHINGCYHHYS